MKNKYQFRSGLYWRFDPERILWEVKLETDGSSTGTLGMHFNALKYSLDKALSIFADEAVEIHSINGKVFDFIKLNITDDKKNSTKKSNV